MSSFSVHVHTEYMNMSHFGADAGCLITEPAFIGGVCWTTMAMGCNPDNQGACVAP